MRLIELHTVVWGPIGPLVAARCVRLNHATFDVHVDLTRTDEDNYWVTGVGRPAPPHQIPESTPLVLSGIPGTVLAVLERDEPHPQFSGVTVRVELEAAMPIVAFSPDPALAVHGGISFEEAMRLSSTDGAAIVNWISEDADAWYFHAFCIGSGCTRISKRDGDATRVANTMPMPRLLTQR